MSENTLQEKSFSAYLPIVISAIIFAFVPCAMQASCMSIFFPSLAQDYGVQTSSITIYLSIGGICMAVWSMVFGKILAKYDLRIITSICVAVVACCFFSFSFCASIYQVWITGALMVVGSLSLLALTIPTLVNRWFKDRAGAIIGFVAAFTGVGGVVFIQVGQAIMGAFGYRTAFFVYAIIVLVVCLPFTLFVIRSRPEDKGMLPYVSKKSVAEGESAASVAAKKNWSVNVSAAMKSPAFYLVCICGGVANIVVMIAQFFPTYVNALQQAGTAVIVTGAILASIVSAGQAVCKFIVGAVSDFGALKMIGASCLFGIIGIACIWLLPTSPMMPIGGFVFGFFYASVSVILPILASAVFGSGENYSIVYGRAMTVINILAIPAGFMWPTIAEVLGGWGSAFVVAIIAIALFAVCAFLAIKIGEKIPREEVAVEQK